MIDATKAVNAAEGIRRLANLLADANLVADVLEKYGSMQSATLAYDARLSATQAKIVEANNHLDELRATATRYVDERNADVIVKRDLISQETREAEARLEAVNGQVVEAQAKLDAVQAQLAAVEKRRAAIVAALG